MNKIGIFLSFCFLICLNYSFCGQVRPVIEKGEDPLEKIYSSNILRRGDKVRLHLGCGQIHLYGYVNIDFPSTEHTVQTIVGADIFADIVSLNFPENSVDEIRSHHFFEHFERPVSMALLCKWHKCLKVGSVLVIETPDFEESVKLFSDPHVSYKDKQKVLRHMFGSHEARWAIHCDGWYREKFAYVLGQLGFSNISFQKAGDGFTRNIVVTANKTEKTNVSKCYEISKNILEESLIDPSGRNISEMKTFTVWCSDFGKIFHR